jgi:hypothetical protein
VVTNCDHKEKTAIEMGRWMSNLPVVEKIERRVLLIRGHRVMLSTDLADLYAVEPRVLMQAVKRNREGIRPFEITDCDFKLGRSPESLSLCLY